MSNYDLAYAAKRFRKASTAIDRLDLGDTDKYEVENLYDLQEDLEQWADSLEVRGEERTGDE